MCTLALVPLPAGGLLLAMNRDELRTRPAARRPTAHSWGGTTAIAPIDTGAGGTWIAATEHRLAFALLNRYDTPAALERALFPMTGAPSRGLLIPALAGLRTPAQVAERCTLDAALLHNLAPFDLVVARPGDSGAGIDAVQVRWDGAQVELITIDDVFLLASPALDQLGTQAARRAAFPALVAACAGATGNGDAQRAARAWFSQHLGGEPGPRGVCMHRAEAATVSHVQVAIDRSGVRLEYVAGSPCAGGHGEAVAFSEEGRDEA